MGGERGLATFKNNRGDYKSNIRSWALPTKDIYYDGKAMSYQGQTKEFPAVIDTGSSFLAVPSDQYLMLRDKWKSQLGAEMQCTDETIFCEVKGSCDLTAKKLSSVGFLIGNTIFELSPRAYLHQGEGICQFAIAQNPLDKHNNGAYIFGDLFLKHFYAVFDYDQEIISLGVNTHSKGLVKMYNAHGAGAAGQRAEAGSTTGSAYETAAASEALAGKAKEDGVANFDGKLAREGGGEIGAESPQDAVKSMPSEGKVEEVMRQDGTTRAALHQVHSSSEPSKTNSTTPASSAAQTSQNKQEPAADTSALP